MPRKRSGTARGPPAVLRERVMAILTEYRESRSLDLDDLCRLLEERHHATCDRDQVETVLRGLIEEGVVVAKTVYWAKPETPPPSDDRHEWDDPEGHHPY